MSDHSLLSPSTAHRWMSCPASVLACRDIPETSSAYADEGTQAHDYAARVLRGELAFSLDDVPGDFREPIGAYVGAILGMSADADESWVEESLDLSAVLGQENEKGTGDFIAVVGPELQVHDLKYGKGVRVEAEGNWQLILYGLGALDMVSLAYDGIESVRLVIHQPRLNSVSEVVYTIAEMEEFKTKLQEGAKVAMGLYRGEYFTQGSFCPGEKQCRFCPAKGSCEALTKSVLSTVVDGFDDLDQTSELPPKIAEAIVNATSLPAEKIGKLLELLPLVRDWCRALDDYALSQLMAGVGIPGWKLVAGRPGNRSWSDDNQAEEALKSMRLKKDEMYSFKVISPTQAEKVLKDSPRKWNKLQPLITRKDPAPTIVPASDKRPALIVAATANDFDDLI